MRTLSCSAARRRLHAFHDRELGVTDQIAVAAHVDRCRACAEVLAEMELVASTLRASTGRRGIMLTHEEVSSFHAGVLNRAKAERDASLFARLRDMFEDMHLVYAGFGAAAAAVVCVVVMLSMMRFATRERSDSLAALVAFVATPGSSANAIAIDAASHARGTARFQAANKDAEQEKVFKLAAVVTRAGRIAADLERLRGQGHRTAAEQIEGLMDDVSRARLEPAQVDGLPVTLSMLWLVTHTTVRASDNAHSLDLVLPAGPAGKKRAAAPLAAHGRGELTT